MIWSADLQIPQSADPPAGASGFPVRRPILLNRSTLLTPLSNVLPVLPAQDNMIPSMALAASVSLTIVDNTKKNVKLSYQLMQTNSQ